MPSPTQSESCSELRLYQEVLRSDTNFDTSVASRLPQQLPSLAELMESFETVTGWELAFAETSSNQGSSSDPSSVISGQLEIIDMSDRIEPGHVARHRRPCTKLADSINGLISLLQENRQTLQDVDCQLCRVVDTPYDWWGMSGKSGFCKGQVTQWSICPDEQIRLFAAKVDSTDATSTAFASTVMMATFESACQIGITLDQIALLLPRVLRQTQSSDHRLGRFASIEMDPITGEFQIDGYEASTCVAMLDLAAGGFVNLEAENMQGVLYSGQVLIVGLNESQRSELEELVTNTEMTTGEFSRIIERKFGNSATLFLYRK